mmetsp:Transcript_18429/g.31516  ORF Transcript_18429/g.31516 Transcript_18429/m.31516 type:complete len:92 (-) Transcript_18429:355-630(-)
MQPSTFLDIHEDQGCQSNGKGSQNCSPDMFNDSSADTNPSSSFMTLDPGQNLESYKKLFKRVHKCLNEFGISDRTNEKNFKSKRKAFLLSD